MTKTISKPTLNEFIPFGYQRNVMRLTRDWDFKESTPEILLSGSYGSAKSVLMAHLGICHAIENPGACIALCRKALPDLKKTIYAEVVNHLDNTGLIEGKHFRTNDTRAEVSLYNGSKFIACTWADKRYKKFRSLKLSMAIFEEITENNADDYEAFFQIKSRLRRVDQITENILLAACNPDSPDHWVYEYFIEPNLKDSHPTREVFYSVTTDNPYLDPAYIEQLRRDLNPKEADRFLRGLWFDMRGDRIYYAYDPEKHFSKRDYNPKPHLPIRLCFDFNIGYGKPMSCTLMQYDPDRDYYYFFDEIIIEGVRTADIIEEYCSRYPDQYQIIIHGDSTGKARDTRSKKSDYDIIRKCLADHDRECEVQVPAKNPPIRTRHNRVNARFLNDLGETRIMLYKKCKVLDKGLRLTRLKDGGQYIEDDSKYEQHVTTALGYGIMAVEIFQNRKSGVVRFGS